MRINKAPFTKRERKNLFLTFLLLLTLPIFVFGLIQNQSFDFRNRAFEEVELSEEKPCIITFPNVNPYSLEINKTFRVQVDSLSNGIGVKSINIVDALGNTYLEKEYTDNPQKIYESFEFTPTQAIAYSITGTMTNSLGESYKCVISSPYDIQGVRAITSNSKPEFISSPKASKPSQSIQAGTTYEYTMEAEDVDGDTINYSYSFTTGQTWLKSTVIDDGSSGRLTIKFQGSTNTPGSYLANIFIHDGYSQHLSSQAWVISVSPEGNDTPLITIIEPVTSVVVEDNSPLYVSWEASDSNQILRYEIYISSNPANENAWQEINKNVQPSKNSYSVDLTSIPDGAYRIIVRAIDNQNPPAIGMDISREILISRESQEDEPDDKVFLPEPQIINVSPTSTDTLENTTPTIKASLVSSEGTTISEDKIEVSLDNKDISSEVKINKISESEYTVIYLPEEPLDEGTHKVSISVEDSQGLDVNKEWTFTIGGEEDENSFYIFGLEIPKRTTYIVLGGIFTILLAIIIPIVIVKIWKSDSRPSLQENPILPKNIPQESNFPVNNRQNVVIQEKSKQTFEAPEPQISKQEQGILNLDEKKLYDAGQEEFEAPEPQILTKNEINKQKTTPPEPKQDLSELYEEIKNLENQNGNKQKNNSPS